MEYVEKIRVAVRIPQSGLEPARGLIALAPLAELHAGPETLLERLNARDRWLPFEREDGVVLLLARHELAWVAPARDVERSLVCPRTWRVTREERVCLRLDGGEELEGLLQMELPEFANRASDFLNGDEDYFTLLTDHGIVLVNKRSVRTVRLFEASPAPVLQDGDHPHR